jgi:S1-C subfamily serine protease
MFKDVSESSFAYRAIEWAKKNGVITGFPDGTFRPQESVTREQMALLLYKMALRDGTFSDVIPNIRKSIGMIAAGPGIGSCVCFKSTGGTSYVLTNCHVVEVGSKYTFVKAGYPNTSATLLKKDQTVDLAILRVESGITPCTVADTPAQVGEAVCVCGAPGGLDESVSVGIISHINRSEGRWFQTDAPINPGNSGGGIFNEAGQLVGIAVAKMSDPLFDGVGFGIKLELVKDFIKGV